MAARAVRCPTDGRVQGGVAATAALGDPNASIPTPQPTLERLGFNSHTSAAGSTSVAFVAQAAIEDGLPERLNTEKKLVPVANCRGRMKGDLPQNTATPQIDVNPDTYAVHIDGELIEHEPAETVPMAQRYFLF